MKTILRYLVLTVGAVVFAYPFLWMIAGSFKPEMEITGFGLWSPNFSLHAYEMVLGKIPLGRAFLNSCIVSGATTASVVLFGSMVGYALARLRFLGSKAVFTLLLFTMMVPFQLVLIPQYILMVKLGLTDTYIGMIAPTMMSAFSIILFRVIWPLSRPVIITVAILTFMTSWNEVLWPMLVVRERTLMTMPQIVTIFTIGGESEAHLGSLLAAATLLALPVIAAYAFFQRYFIESMASSGIKG